MTGRSSPSGTGGARHHPGVGSLRVSSRRPTAPGERTSRKALGAEAGASNVVCIARAARPAVRGPGMDQLVDVWECPRGFDVASVAEIARDRLTEPDLRAQLVSSRGDVLTLQVARGRLTVHVEMLLYVAGRGAFELLRREIWPERRELLTLRAWRPPD